jgi:hypothetical protein
LCSSSSGICWLLVSVSCVVMLFLFSTWPSFRRIAGSLSIVYRI